MNDKVSICLFCEKEIETCWLTLISQEITDVVTSTKYLHCHYVCDLVYSFALNLPSSQKIYVKIIAYQQRSYN